VDRINASGVPAHNFVGAETPYITLNRYRLLWRFWHRVIVGQPFLRFLDL